MNRTIIGGLLVGVMVLVAGCATPPPQPPEEKPQPAKPVTKAKGYTKVKSGAPYTVSGITYTPLNSSAGYVEQGVASCYGKEFHGLPTANGEVFDMEKISAAHPTLPIPVMVRVTNLENGRQMDIRVNDRGPFVKNRVIDLSVAAAKALGYYVKGTALVRVEALESVSKGDLVPMPGDEEPVVVQAIPAVKPTEPKEEAKPVAGKGAIWKQGTPESPKLFVQVGAFRNEENAKRLEKRLQGLGAAQVQSAEVKGARFFRVSIGPVASVEEADLLVESLDTKGFGRGQIVVK